MNAKQDFNQIQGEDAPEIKAFMAGRHAVAILNNGLGHVIYVVQLVQDIATASVVGAEVDAVTIPLNELLLGIKVGVDSVQFLADFGLTCAAQYRSMKAPPGPAGAASRAAWDGMVANYEANLVGDLLTGIFDIIDLSSAGFANAGPVKQGARAVKGVFDTAKFVKGLIKSVLQGWFGVWGGKAFERGAPGGGVHGIAERAAGASILLELQQMKACYTVGDALIGAAADHIAKQLGELNQAATIALGGRDPFVVARDAAVEGLGHVEQRIGDLTQMQALATTASEKATAIETWATETRGTIDSVQMPNIEIPEADIGDDALSDLAEGALNMAGEVAGAGLQLLVDQLNEGINELKSTLTPPVDTIKDHATELGEFMQVVTNEAREQITSTQARVADIKAKLAKCNSFEDVVNMIIQQIFDMVGLESDFQVDDIRQLWVEVGGMIDEGIVWATALASGQPTEPPGGAGAARWRRGSRRRLQVAAWPAAGPRAQAAPRARPRAAPVAARAAAAQLRRRGGRRRARRRCGCGRGIPAVGAAERRHRGARHPAARRRSRGGRRRRRRRPRSTRARSRAVRRPGRCGGRGRRGGRRGRCGCSGRSWRGGRRGRCGCSGRSWRGGRRGRCGCSGRSWRGGRRGRCGCSGRSWRGGRRGRPERPPAAWARPWPEQPAAGWAASRTRSVRRPRAWAAEPAVERAAGRTASRTWSGRRPRRPISPNPLPRVAAGAA